MIIIYSIFLPSSNTKRSLSSERCRLEATCSRKWSLILPGFLYFLNWGISNFSYWVWASSLFLLRNTQGSVVAFVVTFVVCPTDSTENRTPRETVPHSKGREKGLHHNFPWKLNYLEEHWKFCLKYFYLKCSVQIVKLKKIVFKIQKEKWYHFWRKERFIGHFLFVEDFLCLPS